MGIRYVELYQAVAAAKTDLVVVCNGYQVWGVIQSSSKIKEDLLVVYNGYQVCGVMPSSSSSKGPARGL